MALVAERVAGVTLLGLAGARAASRSVVGVVLLWSAFVPFLLLQWGWVSAPRRPSAQQSFQVIALIYLIVALTGMVWLTREAGSHEIGERLRYFWVQRQLYLVLFLSTAVLCGGPRGWLDGAKARAAVAIVLLAWLSSLNHFDNWRYQVRRSAGYQVESFIAEIARQESNHGDRSRVRARLDRGPFSITLGDEPRRRTR